MKTIALWRSETLKALASKDEYKKLERQRLGDITLRLSEDLDATFPFMFRGGDHLERLYCQVIAPAARLASKIHQSPTRYVFSMVADPFCKYKPLMTKDLEANVMIEADTRKTLKPDSSVTADQNGLLGRFIVALEPGLYRLNNGMKDTPLRNPVYLVKLDRPLRKRTQPCA